MNGGDITMRPVSRHRLSLPGSKGVVASVSLGTAGLDSKRFKVNGCSQPHGIL